MLRQLTASGTSIHDLGGGWGCSRPGRTERMAQNPPTIPEGEMQADDFVKTNDEDMAPGTASSRSGLKR